MRAYTLLEYSFNLGSLKSLPVFLNICVSWEEHDTQEIFHLIRPGIESQCMERKGDLYCILSLK